MNIGTLLVLGSGALIVAILGVSLVVAFVLRRVVETNMVHIVQSGRKTVSYGKGRSAGNVYYEVPHFIPLFGVTVTKFPESIFDAHLKDHEAYDVARLPFRVDVQAFFRIADSDVAAQKVANFQELQHQLMGVLQGAVRRVLATHKLEEILEARTSLAQAFTEEVDANIKAWGVETVKTIEFMDLRDSGESKVIQQIMAKEKSRIDMESRVVVATNAQTAKEREIEAQREVDLSTQQAAQAVGERTAQQEQAVGIAQEQASQQVLAERRVTTERQMEVQQVAQVRNAEIARQVAEVAATQDKNVAIVKAEGEQQQTIIVAEGRLEEAKRDAQGIQAKGEAEGKAQTAINLAAVTPQITLAKEIGENQGYQSYLVNVRQVEAVEAVGKANAEALKAADIKVIANGGNVTAGFETISDVFSSKGGQAIGAMLEGLKQTESGAAVVDRVTKPAKPNGARPNA